MTATVFVLALTLSACSSSGTALSPSVLDSLPGLQQLDGLRGTAALLGEDVAVTAPVQTAQTSVAGSALAFDDGGGGNLAYAVYRFLVPAEATLLSATADGGAGLWLLAADYGPGYWTAQTPLGLAADDPLDLSSLADPTSPDGYLYLAVLAEPGASATLSALHVAYDGPEPPPTFYVSPDGDDAGPGSSELPWATLQHAANTLVAGQRVVVRPGEYSGFHQQRSGLPGQPIWFAAETGAQITAPNANTPDGINIENWGDEGPGGIAHVIVEGFTVAGMPRAGIRIVGSADSPASFVTVRGNVCGNNGSWGILSGFADDLHVINNECFESVNEHGIYLSNSGDRNIVMGNYCHHNAASGIQFNADASLGGDGIMSFALIEHNICQGNGVVGGAALNMDGLQDSVIRGNLLFDNQATGLVLYSGDGLGSQRNLVVCNTILMPPTGRWCVTINTDSGGNRLYDNILLNDHSFRGTVDIDSASLAGFESDYNAVSDRFVIDGAGLRTLQQWQVETGQDGHSFVSEPQIVLEDPEAFLFRPRPGGPAVDSALALPEGMPTADIDGVLRPQGSGYDLGALELEL